MPDIFLQLSAADRREALLAAAPGARRPLHLLDKDVWVVWALDTLFRSPIGDDLVFKGGTSLSKAYRFINRFSEDVDLTYDIRKLIPDLVGESGDPIPPNRSQADKWKKKVDERLPELILDQVYPHVERSLSTFKNATQLRLEHDKLYLDYAPLAEGTGYAAPTVTLEFGARSTGEPCEPRPVQCDAAPHLQEVEFPSAYPRVMAAERTFWEKATAAHVYCKRGDFRNAERFARHWHDIDRLDKAGIVDAALADPDIGQDVAIHKSCFFREAGVDYHQAVSGHLQIVPAAEPLKALSDDYEAMVKEGLLEEVEPFDVLMARCKQIEAKVNELASS